MTKIHRDKVLKIYSDALISVRGDVCVSQYLQSELFQSRLGVNEKVAILAIGKAAQSMAQGACNVLKKSVFTGLVITKKDHLSPFLINIFEYFESSHPIPSQKSLIAGEKVVDFITHLPENTHLVVLISGGASSLVEQLKPNIGLDDLIRVNNWLISSGLAIEEINQIRQKLSLIKGGQLASFVKHLKVSNLLLSDVLSDNPAYIGSGLFVSDSSHHTDIKTPDWLEKILSRAIVSKSEKSSSNIHTSLVASNSMLLKSISKISRQSDNVYVSDAPLSLSVENEAELIASKLLSGKEGIYIWGGEPTVELSNYSGQIGEGGRNQHLAFLISKKIKDVDNVLVLCIGTDGTDGSTEDAGALIDGQTIMRAESEGLNTQEHLDTYNSSAFLNASGDVIHTGPTGTNVMDVVIAYKWE